MQREEILDVKMITGDAKLMSETSLQLNEEASAHMWSVMQRPR